MAGEENHKLVVVDLTTMRVLATHSVGEDPDVLALDPGLKRLYVSAESGHVTVFREHGKTLTSEGGLFIPMRTRFVLTRIHIWSTSLCKILMAGPLLRIMEPAQTQ